MNTELNITNLEEKAWLLQQQTSEDNYRIAFAYQINGSIDIKKLISSIENLPKYFPSMCAKFQFNSDGILNKYYDDNNKLPVQTFTNCTETDAINRILHEQNQQLDLKSQLGIEFFVFAENENNVILGIVVNCIVLCSVSLENILSALSQLYNEHAQKLDKKPISELLNQYDTVNLTNYWTNIYPNGLSKTSFPSSLASNKTEIVDAKKREFLDSHLKHEVCSSYTASISINKITRFIDSEINHNKIYQVILSLFGSYLTCFFNKNSIDMLATFQLPNNEFSKSIELTRLLLIPITIADKDSNIVDILKNTETLFNTVEPKDLISKEEIASITNTQFEDMPNVIITRSFDLAEFIKFNNTNVKTIWIPSLQSSFDITLNVQSSSNNSITLELCTGNKLTPNLGGFMLDQFLVFLERQRVDRPAVMESIFCAKDVNQNNVDELSTDQIAEIILQEFRDTLATPEMTIYDNFFDFGGHSLLATRIIGRLLSIYNFELRINDLFNYPTALSLSKSIVHHKSDNDVIKVHEYQVNNKDNNAPLSLAQKSLWKVYSAFGFNSIFNIPFALRFREHIDESVFKIAFQDVVFRHSSMRTLFIENADGVIQKIINVEDLPNYKWFWFSEESKSTDFVHELQKASNYRFDLSEELPFRIKFFKDAKSNQQILSLLFHHVIIDEWSVNLLMDELENAYKYRLENKIPQWKYSPVSFHDYALQQFETGLSQERIDFWINSLGAIPKVPVVFLNNNSDLQEVSSLANDGGWVQFELDEITSQALYILAKNNNASLFNVLYSGITASLYFIGANNELLVGTSASGRNDPVYFDTIGYFTTVVMHKICFDNSMTVSDLIDQVKNKINLSMPYTDVPIDLVEDVILGNNDLRKEHLFDVFIQIHAKNKLNGAFTLIDGKKINFSQIDPDRSESLLGLHFEVLEETVPDKKTIRFVLSYRKDRYNLSRINLITDTINRVFRLFSEDCNHMPLNKIKENLLKQ